jgi:hypothetical protein
LRPIAEAVKSTQTLWLKQSMDYDDETTTHIEEVVTLSMVNDAETTTHAEEAVTPSVVYDAETTTQNYYIDHNSRTLS